MKKLLFVLSILFLSAFSLNAQELSDNQLREIAKSLAISMTSKEVRDFVKTEASKQFDKDYDFLIKNVINLKLSNGKPFADVLKSRLSSTIDMARLVTNNPRLQVSVPIKCTEWNTTNEVPLVAFVPINFDDKKIKEVEAYDNQGRLTKVGVNDDSKPLVVIGLNERTTANGQLIPQYDNSTTPTNRNSNGGRCYGTDGGWEYLNQFKVSSWSQIEPLILGKPEVDFIAKKVSDGSNIFPITNGMRLNLTRSTNWQTLNASLFRWFYQTIGTPQIGNCFYAYFVERDGGAVQSIPISFTYKNENGVQIPVNINVPVANNDDPVSEGAIYFEDCNNMIHSFGVAQLKFYRN